MPKNRNGVVVASRRYCFAVGPRPFLAIGLCDLTNFGFIQTRPTLLQRSQTFPPVISRSRFDTRVVIETSLLPLLTRSRCSFRNSASLACATLRCEVLSDFQTSWPPAKALA